MDRRDFLRLGSAAAAGMPLAGCLSGRSIRRSRPNIVYVFSDEHRWQSLPFAEEAHIHAPNMMRMAAEGTQLRNCVSTSPICSPYRAMLMTGQWPHQSGYVSNHWLGDGRSIGITSPTLGHVFSQGGYRAGYIGKWHLMSETCANAGFEVFQHWLYGDDHMKTEVRDVAAGEDFHTESGYNAVGMTDQAIEFMDSRDDRPFFLMLSLNPPHWRWDDAPEEYMALYPDEEMSFRPNVIGEWKEGRQRFYFRNYQAHISAVDDQLGRIMDYLKAAGLEEDTIVIYTSDHGSSFGSNGVGSKANPFEEAVRVPFVVRCPGQIPSGRTVGATVGTMDMFPTLCGLAGLGVPSHCGGRDVSSMLFGGADAGPETQFLTVNNFPKNYFRNLVLQEHTIPQCAFRAVRSERYTYAVHSEGEWFLHDNQADPYQMNNRIDDPALADVKTHLRAELETWLSIAEDPFIPDAWRALPLPERIAEQHRHYTLLPFEQERAQYKQDAVAAVGGTVSDELTEAADRIFDAEFFGLYLALHKESAGGKRWSDEPAEEIRRRLEQLERERSAMFRTEVNRIAGRE